jgi:RNA polymerase sigma-70 factor, ECF subfamily
MMIATSEDEILLLERICSRDQAAMGQLYDRYARVLYSFALKMLHSVEEAEEVVVDVFAQVWQTAHTFDVSRGRVDNWLFLMTRSRALDRLRRRQRQTKITDAATHVAVAEVSFAGDLPQEEVIILERREQVLQAMAQLPSEQRQILELAYYEGLSQSEISQQLGLPLGTVKTRVRLGLTKLKTLLAKII